MNRRAFLASLLATATLDPERLLWVPGATTIFIPAPIPDDPWGPIYRYHGNVFHSSSRSEGPYGDVFNWRWIGDGVKQSAENTFTHHVLHSYVAIESQICLNQLRRYQVRYVTTD